MKFLPLVSAAVASFTFGLAVPGSLRQFNAEEHKLVGDRGVEAVEIPESVRLPFEITFDSVGPDEYIRGMQRAKKLAIGFESNDEHDYNASAGAVQDHCYQTSPVNAFMQSDYNRKIWIPPVSETPKRVLFLPGYTSSGAAHLFTFGELVGFYGDLRQIPYCEGVVCYVTNADIDEVRFLHSPLGSDKSCPQPVSAGDYIADLGSGLVPPLGKLGNAIVNTAKSSSDYWDAGWWGDEMLRIAKVNDSHFSTVAVAWYVGMHRLALIYADSARADPNYWLRALHYEANALHNLTDLFLFGHDVVNADQVSHNIIEESGIENGDVYQWMENVIRMGGGRRGDDGAVTLTSELPALRDRPGVRNASQDIRASKALSAKRLADMFYHNAFNASGATVRNLRGDEFTILGDGDLDTELGLYPLSVDVTARAVTASVQSLFDAFDALSRGATTMEQASRDSAFFGALRYLPVYVVHDPNKYFTGRWLRYARAANELSGAGKKLDGWPDCRIPLISGAYFQPNVTQIIDIAITGDMLRWPPRRDKPCAVF